MVTRLPMLHLGDICKSGAYVVKLFLLVFYTATRSLGQLMVKLSLSNLLVFYGYNSILGERNRRGKKLNGQVRHYNLCF